MAVLMAKRATTVYDVQLTQDEVYTLLAVLRRVGGDTRRKDVDRVLATLLDEYDGDLSNVHNVSNSIYFVGGG